VKIEMEIPLPVVASNMNAQKPADRSWIFNYSSAKETTIKQLCQRVEEYFQLPPRRLCRYFADADDPCLITMNHPHFRGFHAPISDRCKLPIDLQRCFCHPAEDSREGATFAEMVAFDNLIYIRRSICADTTGLVETYAHELQHFVQHGNTPRLWVVNRKLCHNLKRFKPTAIPTDIPYEAEANIVSKCVAEKICGVETVMAFAEEQVRLMDGDQEQKSRWIFFRDVPSSMEYDLREKTLAMVEEYKTQLDFGIDVDQPEWWVGPAK